ncbi:MAG: GNAT family N-acetyltransferase [Deltaproteobacteria bacterium]|nr:GNAT family N-acetyltransferase [Deltaproteobacteria bacterium]
MEHKSPAKIKIREINPESQAEVSLVALRMRLTLIERVGEEKATAMYSLDWLVNRVLWHLDPSQTTAKVFLAEDRDGRVVAHAIARIERDENGRAFGYFSTIYVEPLLRNQGLATSLLLKVESWLSEMKMPKIIYNTAANHEKLIRLFGRHGYSVTHRESEMVQLTKQLH